MDTSSPRSVIAAAREIQHRYRHVDWLFCNAGIMPVSGVNWGALWPPSPSNLYFNFSTGGNLLRTVDDSTPEGLRKVFATNVLGHYLMIQELEDFLASQGRPCHIIWTSSSSASRASFDPSDLQGEKSNDSYASSKKLIDLISREMNSKLNAKGIYSHTTCPGLVMTQLTYGILPKWCWVLIFPILVLIRLLMTHFMTVDPHNGSEALVWLSRQEPASLDHSLKYYSRTNALGKNYVESKKIPGSEELSKDALARLQQFSEKFTTESLPTEELAED